MASLLSVEDARRRVLAAVDRLDTEEVGISEAHGRVLPAAVTAPHPLPRFDNSAMDGYAVRSEDVAGASDGAPAVLEVLAEVRAGEPGDAKVLPGGAARIMTGAPVPPGADAVVPVEETEEAGGRVTIKAAAEPGRNIRPAGDDLSAGDVLVPAGVELRSGELALLASMGFSPVEVVRVPAVAIVVTGDELVAPEATPRPGQIRDSNSVALGSLVVEAGGEPTVFGPIADERDDVLRAFEQAAARADLVISSGGVAVGKYDFVKDVVEELGRIDLWRVAMQPGKPVVLGAVEDTPFLGLPGNPVSIHIGFEQFVRPAIRKMLGCTSLLRPIIKATLTQTIEKKPGRLHFIRVRLQPDGDGWRATPTGAQGSHIQSSLVDCHGVARFEADRSRLDGGSEVVVEVWQLPGEGAR